MLTNSACSYLFNVAAHLLTRGYNNCGYTGNCWKSRFYYLLSILESISFLLSLSNILAPYLKHRITLSIYMLTKMIESAHYFYYDRHTIALINCSSQYPGKNSVHTGKSLQDLYFSVIERRQISIEFESDCRYPYGLKVFLWTLSLPVLLGVVWGCSRVFC